MNYWKIGSRWSEDGNTGSSILEIFRKNNIVFAGSKMDRISNEVKIGDFIAISDGKKIVGISKVLENPKPITEFEITESDKSKFAFEDWVIGVKVNIVDLENPIEYRIGTFHKLNEHREMLRNIYENSGKKFEIIANTYTVKNSEKEKELLNPNIKYLIPIYQRPYSWGEPQLTKFINDIFSSYREKEPIFFGTMQFGAKEFLDKNQYLQEVIDGQQRLSTILVFLKVLHLNFKEIKSDFQKYFEEKFETEVNNNIQNDYLREFIAVDSIEELVSKSTEVNNIYVRNGIILNQKLHDFIDDNFSENENEAFDVNDFLENHFYRNLFFVVIETKAGLSKTLQIFDTINTTGLDLQGADIFKLRFYEYLKDSQKEGKKVFQEINKLYERVDEARKSGIGIDMNQVLSIYQIYLIGKYDLNQTLYSLNSNTFFERFFDKILAINAHLNFEKINRENVEVSIQEVSDIIDARIKFHNEFPKGIEHCEYSLLFWSRYGRYWLWIFIYYLKYGSGENHLANRKIFIEKLSKLLNIYSVYYAKSIGNIHSFMRGLNREILKGVKFEEVIREIDEKIKSTKDSFENQFSKNIVGNAKWKNIICRTSAMLEETDVEQIEGLLFKNDPRIDIEHIQCFTDKQDAVKIREEWGSVLNSLGNLMVLEEHRNRAIGNDFTKKDEHYKDSKFQIVRNFRGEKFIPENWTKEKAEERLQSELKKLSEYYYS